MEQQTITSNNICLPESLIHCIDNEGRVLIELPELPSTFTADINSEENDDDLILVYGRISSLLMPVSNDSNDQMSSMMSDQMTMTADTRTRAMRFSMVQNVTWILAGDWSLAAKQDAGNSTVSFNSTFTKVTVDGEMRHNHTIANFKPASDYVAGDYSNSEITIPGTADVYFNEELAWSQAKLNLTLLNHSVLRIDIDSSDVDNHFHGESIYGVVTSETVGKPGMAATPRNGK